MSAEPRTKRRARLAQLDDLPIAGRAERLTVLGSKAMLVAITADELPRRGSIRGRIVTSAGEHRFTGTTLTEWQTRGDGPAIFAVFPVTDAPLPASGQVVLDRGDRTVVLTPTVLAEVAVSIEAFVEDALASHDAAARHTAAEELLSAVARRGSLDDASAGLMTVRDAILPRYPLTEVRPTADVALHIDAIWRIDQCSFYLEGWMFDRYEQMTRIQLVSPEGRRVPVESCLTRYRRPDVSEFLSVSPRALLGFVCFVNLPEPSHAASGWVLQAGSDDAIGFEAEVPVAVDDPGVIRSVLLEDLRLPTPFPEEILARQVGPAMSRLQARLAAQIEVDVVDQLGVPPERPEVSIIIPLYRQIEFLEMQLSQFVLDPAMARQDIIYVLDSPDDAAYLRPLAEHLFNLYGVPFRLAVLSANGGYSVVNNLGASLASGKLLLLLNSDVLPDCPGWIGRMAAAYRELDDVGALSPKLLYEDDSIQHAGLYFDRAPGATTWSNEHFFKGLHRDFPAANVSRVVPAVTGACLMIDTELFRSLDGFSSTYVRGDYEDSDLCLRLRQRGLQSWYLPHVELYHLEGQSYPSRERDTASRFNRLLHSHRWRETLRAIEGAA